VAIQTPSKPENTAFQDLPHLDCHVAQLLAMTGGGVNSNNTGEPSPCAKRRRPKMSGKKLLIILVVLIILVLLAYTIINDPAQTAELRKVEVFGRNMRVEIAGSFDDVIVILPGWGVPVPAISYRSLATLLSENFTVVTVEYFGYGFSDPPDKRRPRSVDNISEELHEALNNLGYYEYILMPHSLSGIVTLYHANKYPDEVKAVAGLDTSVPAQFPPDDHEGTLASLRSGTSEFSFNEMSELLKSMDRVSNLTFPDTIPVIHFLSKEVEEEYAAETGQSWKGIHENLIGDKENSSTVMLDGGHMVMYSQPKKIAEEFYLWFQGLE